MSRKFKISDFVITNDDIPKLIADRILKYHLEPLQTIQDNFHVEVKVSQNSCFRPYYYEIKRGRSGNSQHCFGQRKSGKINSKNNFGANDITCFDFANNKNKLLDALIKHTSYNRIAIYNTFIHCDYKDNTKGKRILFNATNGKWISTKIL